MSLSSITNTSSQFSTGFPAGPIGYVSLGSVFDQNQSINAGFAVDDWRPNHFYSGTDVVTGQPVNNIFTGVNADVGVSDSDAWLYKLTYNITLLGKIVFIAPAIIF
jgi:hypothetical protein